MSFARLGLAPAITSALESLNYQQPTEIQQKAIPVVLSGRNLLAAAQTGTGKTAAFGLPLIERLSQGKTERKKRVRAVILAPTRELVVQVADNLGAYAANLPLTVLAMYGGVDMQAQKQALIAGVDILVATPGRLKDMYHQRAVYFEEIQVMVLDEADRMLDMGFIEVINDLISRMPTNRQNLLFSATLSPRIRELAKTAVPDPVEIAIAKPSKKEISQWLVTVDKDAKSALLSHLIQTEQWQQALIFIETKHGAAKLVSQLEKRGIRAEAFHSGRSQASREQVLSEFKDGSLQYLVATGVAARGIDVDKLERVVNYDLPFPPDEYIHRIGRTGRAGMTGEAVSLLSKDDFKNLCMIESRLGHVIERRVIEGFEPKKPIPVSILDYKPKSQPKAQRSSQRKAQRSSQPSSQLNSQPVSQPKARPEKPRASEGGTAAKNPWAAAQRKKPANPQRGTSAARSGTPKGKDSGKPRG
ncbi:DEAD/DEAH box helicase [Shewanella khirikhana]|uniref:ATP-dependent RNA helicase RhlE n=1 Tax=Shewanella khirikhana TaxID=1965282 RepID=A0ABM7DX36_9GAMM|nr:DEAD/DEAH box helicase [Shewanella khirikhana]AZQ13109.1 ATP-dependent RNA helicase RhlE [Shewanella khirikhana]